MSELAYRCHWSVFAVISEAGGGLYGASQCVGLRDIFERLRIGTCPVRQATEREQGFDPRGRFGCCVRRLGF